VADHQDPDVREIVFHAREAVGAGCLGGFLRDGDDDFDDEEEEEDDSAGFEAEGSPWDDVVAFAAVAEAAAAGLAVSRLLK
jgi:hypothetical protein